MTRTDLRTIQQVLTARDSTDGDGVRIQRNLGKHRHDMDPFLMLDEIRSADSADYIGGFPSHPHRGIQTLTYMLAGGFVHEDSMGHRETLRDGGVQWMSAGRGVIHSELPLIHEGLLHGFQLWVNLPRTRKLEAPAYRQASGDQLPAATAGNGAVLRAVAGQWHIDGHTLASPIDGLACAARVLDVTLPANAALELALPEADTALAYVFAGALAGQTAVQAQQLAFFTLGSHLALQAGAAGAHLLLLTGTPLGEPIAQYGPFVMNTDDEIRQAVNDYRNGILVQG